MNGIKASANLQANPNVGGAKRPSFQEVWNTVQGPGQSAPVRQPKKSLGKDDFLKIMITQMKNQDPTKPFEAEKLATEIAQIASVEQLGNVNKALKQLSQQNRPLERLAMTNLIGKTVTVDRTVFPHREGENQPISYSLGEDATQVKVSLINEKGEVVLEKELGEQGKGPQTFIWNGKNHSQQAAAAGKYMMKIEATGANGRPILAGTTYRSQVIGVGYEGQDPVLLVSGNNGQEKVNMKNVVQIEQASFTPVQMAANQNQVAAQQPVAKAQFNTPGAQGKNVFTYEKGKGSRTLNANEIPKETLDALKKHIEGNVVPARAKDVAQNQAAGQPAQAQPTTGQTAPAQAAAPTGFPNGLNFFNQNQKGGGQK